MPCPVARVLAAAPSLAAACLVAADSRSSTRRARRGLHELLAGLDAGRVPQGRGRAALDRQRRPRHARPRPRAWCTTSARPPSGGCSSATATRSGPATGNDGKVWKVDGGRQGLVAFDAAELEVHALAPAPSGGVFAASSPDGKVYRVAADGPATPFFDPEDKYIWSLAAAPTARSTSARARRAASTRSIATAAGALFYESETTHVTSLVARSAGARCSSARRRRAASSASTPSGTASCCSNRRYKEIRGLRVGPDGHDLRHRGRRGAARRRPPTPPPSKSPAETTAGRSRR